MKSRPANGRSVSPEDISVRCDTFSCGRASAGGDEEILSLALAPDGKSFAVAQGGWKHDAVLLRGLH